MKNNSTVKIFNSKISAQGFSDKVNGLITVTKRGKYKVRYIHKSKIQENES
jgi:hypothetical protein